MTCKWLSDDFTAVCTNADCPACADFCPTTQYPTLCNYYEERKEQSATANKIDIESVVDAVLTLLDNGVMPKKLYVSRGVRDALVEQTRHVRTPFSTIVPCDCGYYICGIPLEVED